MPLFRTPDRRALQEAVYWPNNRRIVKHCAVWCSVSNHSLPVLVADVPADHAIAREEVFGPVLVAMPFRDEARAIELANGTDYGLAAGIWTRDGARQLRVAKALSSGQVFINDYGAGGGVELPFGGVKKSGYGRETGLAGLLGFTTLKTIAIKHD